VLLVVCTPLVASTDHQAKVDIRDNRYYRASVAVATPRQYIWALIDFQSSELAVDPSVASESKTYNSIDGFDFLVIGESNPLYLPIAVADPVVENRLLQSESLLLLGLGPGSPLWRFYRCVTFAGSFLRFSKHACDCDHVVIECDVDQGLGPMAPDLCVATGTIGLENRVEAQPVTTTFFGPLAFPPDVYSDLRFKSDPFHNTKAYLPDVVVNGDLRLSDDVYLLRTDTRRIFRAGLADNHTAVVSEDVVLDWQISIDRRLGQLCAVKAPITLHTSTFYALLTLGFALALPCWYFVDEPHTSAFVAPRQRNIRQSHPFGTISAVSIVALTVIFIVDFVSNAEVWHFPLPDSEWILPFYVTLQAFGALSAVVYVARIDKRPWPSQTLFIEPSIWIGFWLIQISATRGSWDLLGASLVFVVFYVVWWQHIWIMILSIWALDKLWDLKVKYGDPRRSVVCSDFVNKALRICVNKPLINRLVWFMLVLTGVHTYVLWRWILVPLFSALANFGFAIGTAMTSLVISVAIYTASWLAEDHLSAAVSLDSTSKNETNQHV
jgi:hypothetical protein